MLEAIREKAQGVVATLIIGVIIVIFGVWGVESYLQGESQVNVAKVDGVEISVDAYRATLDRQRQYMYQLLGKNADPRMFDNPAFRKRVVENMVDEVLVSQHAQDHGYRVADRQVADAVQATPQFQDQNGHFDSALYLSTLRAAGLSAAGYEQGIREDMTGEQVRSGFSQAVIVPAAELDRLLKLETQRRSFSYAVISPEQFKTKVTPTDAEINDHYSNHRGEFKVPAQVRAEVIRLSAASLAKNVKVSDEELRQLYEEESSRYVTPEERRARHILVSVAPSAKDEDAKKALTQAQDLRKQVVAGNNFAALAKKHSQDPGSALKGGDLGFSRRGAFVKEFEDALFSLKRGEISQPVKTKYGYHIIRLESVKPEVRKPFTQVRGELETMLRNRKAEDQFFEATQTLQNLVYENPESLQAAAETLDLRVERTGWFSRAGGSGVDSKLVESAFGPDVYAGHRNSDVIELGPASVAALHVVDRQEERVRELTEVRAQIVERLRARSAEQAAVKAAESLLERVNQGRDFAAEARAVGAKFTAGQTVTRRKTEGVNPQVVAAIFKAPRPADKPVQDIVNVGGGGAVVFSLTRVMDGDPNDVDLAARQELERVLERRAGDELFQAYLADLRKRKSIAIYENQF